MTHPNTLVYWATEREQIRRRKEAGEPAPWSQDPILSTYRFTNLRRRDDRVSRWLLRYVLDATLYDGNQYPISFLEFSALCRWLNWPPTIQALIDAGLWPVAELDYRAIVKLIDRLPGKVWTGAYMIRAKPGHNRSKAHFVVNEVIHQAMSPVRVGLLSAAQGGIAEGVWEILVSRLNWGSFMAGQVVADWTYTPLLSGAEDLYRWAPQGPGSRRGFNRLLGRPLGNPIPESEWLYYLRLWREEIITALGPEYDDLTAMDTQNALCELDKFLRVKNGEGRPRSRYQPETAYV